MFHSVVEGWFRAAVTQPTPTPTPVSGLELPTRGRLLVSDAGGLYVVERNGKRRRIGAAQDATWSPRGLYVAAARGTTLFAIDPDDRSVRWQLRRPERVSLPRWSPGDGFYVAYRSGRDLPRHGSLRAGGCSRSEGWYRARFRRRHVVRRRRDEQAGLIRGQQRNGEFQTPRNEDRQHEHDDDDDAEAATGR